MCRTPVISENCSYAVLPGSNMYTYTKLTVTCRPGLIFATKKINYFLIKYVCKAGSVTC